MFLSFRGGLLPATTWRVRSAMRCAAALAVLVFAFCVLPFAFSFVAHTQAPAANRGVVRLKVRYKSSAGTKDLPRKRFFLIKGSLAENKSLIERAKQTEVMSRDCYYRAKGASAGLIKWLKDNDCESPHCREVEEKYLSGAEAVPEFQAAFEPAIRDLKDRQVARRWLTNYLRPELRFGFYEQRQKAIQTLIAEAEATTKTPVMSIMTDRKGTAYLTNIEPGIYTISNLIGSETEKTNILWI